MESGIAASSHSHRFYFCMGLDGVQLLRLDEYNRRTAVEAVSVNRERGTRGSRDSMQTQKQRRPGQKGNRPPSFKQHLLFLLEAIFVIPLGTLVSCLPWKLARPLGILVGDVVFLLGKRDRRQAYYNLDVMFPDGECSQTEKDRIVKQLFRNIALGAVEYLKMGDLRGGNHEQFVEIGDYTPLQHALEQGKGVLAVSAHFGNWEYLGSTVAKLGLSVGALIDRQENPYTDKWLKGIREKWGKVKCFYDDSSAMFHVDTLLKRNGILGLMADQRDIRRPVFVPFFGISSPTRDGPARLHLWYEAPIVFAFAVKQNNGKYLLSVEGPYGFERSGDLSEDCRRIMACINLKYEEMIRKYPDQWFSLLTPRWGHPR
jgi:KDO2-lipid IV(A) lauroyltransferase